MFQITEQVEANLDANVNNTDTLPTNTPLQQSNDETKPLIEKEQQEIQQQQLDEPKATILTSLVNNLNSIVGVGVMTLPYCFYIDGYGLGTIFYLSFIFLCHIAFIYIAEASEYYQLFDYKTLCSQIFGKVWGWIIPIVVIIYVSGSLASYSIAMMDQFFWWSDTDNHPEYQTYKMILVTCIFVFILFPLASLRTLNFMRGSSYIALTCLFLIMIIVVAYYFIDGQLGDDPVAFYNAGFQVMTTWPLFSASQCGHFGTPFLYYEIKDRSMKKMNKVILYNGLIILITYSLIGYFGYFTFTDTVHSDLLKSMAAQAEGKWYIKAANILQLLLIITHFPATCFGCRKQIECLIFTRRPTPTWARYLIVFCIVAIMLIISFFVTEVSDVLDITSSLAGSFVILAIPGLFKLNLLWKQHDKRWYKWILPSILVIVGLIQFFCGLISTFLGY